ncbi:hypothetical protein D7V86_13695 [bacterium D16-51]|nr:hypothetical protein D7V96_16185 [bacterium D16-59]RKI59241.1 hypothetical protein D7V86_13695 [bacterium D16-51]
MKKRMKSKCMVFMSLFLLTAALLSGCGESGEKERQNTGSTADVTQESKTSDGNTTDSTDGQNKAADDVTKTSAGELEVCFGDKGNPFMLQLNDNDTAGAIARHVGTSDWRLPIYEDDEDADYDVMQYYDIPSSYDIPSNPEKVTSVKAGEVYYSDPNRIVLFYQDAEVSEEYTPVGHFDATDEFVEAVKNNPVLEGWGNKIVLITKP